MPKYWGGIISHTGVSPKWVKSKRKEERRKTKKKEKKLVITMAELRMAHASTHCPRMGQNLVHSYHILADDWLSFASMKQICTKCDL